MIQIRQAYTTYEKEEDFSREKIFSMDLGFQSLCEFDNVEAMGKRMVFLLLESGTGIIDIDGRQIPYMAPSILCINEKEHVVIKKNKDCSMKALFFHPKIINSGLNYENIRQMPEDAPTTLRQDRALLFTFIEDRAKYLNCLSLGSMSCKRITTLFSKMNAQIENQDNDNWPCKCRTYVMELLFMLESLYEADGYEDEVHLERVKEDFSPILAYIYLHYNEKITVADLTEHFHICKTNLAKMFRENVDSTFVDYLNKLRIHMATVMLRDTDLPIQEIMYRVGFTDNAHFFRMFKRFIGQAPSVYREQNSSLTHKDN